MLLLTSIYLFIRLILTQIIFAHSEHVRKDFLFTSNNTIYPAKSWQSGTSRTKRSIYNDMPQFLNMAFQLDGQPVISIKLTKQLPILANEYLPVIANQVMDDVGEFVMYQDVGNNIAIVYFEKFRKFYGVIGLNHHIADLPYNFDANGNYLSGLIEKHYVYENHHQFLHINPNVNYPPPSDTDAWEDFIRPFDFTSNGIPRRDFLETRRSENSLLSEKNITSHHNGTRYIPKRTPIVFGPWIYRQYYIETLILVTHDLVDLFKENFGEEEYIAAVVRYHIIYFNAVNMLLKKLNKLQNDYFDVTLNIAKIVIEMGSTSFGLKEDGELQFRNVIKELQYLFSSHSDFYTQDSFDYVFVHTKRTIMDENILINAISKYGQDMVEGRITGRFYETIPITVAKFEKFFAYYASAAHEIARTLGVKITPKENGLRPTGQCHSTMQREGPKCNTCLAWTDDNHYEFLLFFSKNRNRCFLLNEPRSLRPPIMIRILTPNKQCQCLGYESYMKTSKYKVQSDVRHEGCSLPLRCQNVRNFQQFHEDTILPFDGTPCGSRKVCWEGKCRNIGSSSTNTSQE